MKIKFATPRDNNNTSGVLRIVADGCVRAAWTHTPLAHTPAGAFCSPCPADPRASPTRGSACWVTCDGTSHSLLCPQPARYNAPLSAGDFVDLVSRGFYNGMEIQRADGFVVQTGRPADVSVGWASSGLGSRWQGGSRPMKRALTAEPCCHWWNAGVVWTDAGPAESWCRGKGLSRMARCGASPLR